MNPEIISGNEAPKRPVFLTVLCILTFVAGGIEFISALFTPVFAEQIIELFKSAPNYDEVAMSEAITILRAGWTYYLIRAVLTLGSLSGAILMWKLKKTGFHIYALSNLIALFVPMLMFSIAIGWSSILVTACFIALYALHLKHMK